MNDEDYALIMKIKSRVKEKPELIQPVVNALMGGAEDAISEARRMAADMETVASVAISMVGEKRVTKKTKEYFEKLVLSKLEKHIEHTHLNWKWALR